MQNRVTPSGGLEAVAARGAWLGNRGVIHDEHQVIVAQWRSKAWITCRLHYRGVRRAVFSPHTWSELFFLDEATAFAAGHRPCAYCRRARYRDFKRAWCAANRWLGLGDHPRVGLIDARLHAERVAGGGGKRAWPAACCELPAGTFVRWNGGPCLAWRGRLYPWSHWGYAEPLPLPAAVVEVLTPPSIVAVFRSGFRPQVHDSAWS
ncbi:MAG: hypothetical protein EPN38_10760 [Rhodanobacteraceae bacterium]|nr:MAG: hypothetical protein EPN38_10760 [Rhodanobacteraceae bacterium]